MAVTVTYKLVLGHRSQKMIEPFSHNILCDITLLRAAVITN